MIDLLRLLRSLYEMIVKYSAFVILLALVPFASAKDLYYNDLKVPRGMDDLKAIQNDLLEALKITYPATVCIQLGDGSGSGVIISPDGLILTAAHVSAGVDKDLIVVMQDGTEHEAVSLGLDSETDAAMVKILNAKDLPFVEIDKNNRTKLGDWVFALGHSGGYDKKRGSVTRLGRLVRTSEGTIQSDCALIGGDSGGPLFDMKGRLIGINSRVGVTVEESMHAPMTEFIRNWEKMLGGEFIGNGPFAERPKKGDALLGVVLEKPEKGSGLILKEVIKKSAAARAGLESGDVMLTYEGQEVSEIVDLQKLIKENTPGDLVKISYRRGEAEAVEVEVKLKSR